MNEKSSQNEKTRAASDGPLFREWVPLTDLIERIPPKFHQGFVSRDLLLTCVTCTQDSLVAGSNAGILFWFDRGSDLVCRKTVDERYLPVTAVALSSKEKLAAGNQLGSVAVFSSDFSEVTPVSTWLNLSWCIINNFIIFLSDFSSLFGALYSNHFTMLGQGWNPPLIWRWARPCSAQYVYRQQDSSTEASGPWKLCDCAAALQPKQQSDPHFIIEEGSGGRHGQAQVSCSGWTEREEESSTFWSWLWYSWEWTGDLQLPSWFEALGVKQHRCCQPNIDIQRISEQTTG